MNSSDTRPVVVGVDGAPGSAGALRYAVAEASRRAVPLHLVHTSPSLVTMGLPFGHSGGTILPLPAAELERVGTAVLDEAATTVHRIAAEVEIVTRLVPGPAATALVEYSAHAQLVVIGRETRRGLDRLFSGATTAAVAARA